MTSHRQDRIAVEIQRILSNIVQNEMKDPRINSGKVSISRVEASPDVSFARVYFSLLGSEEERQEAFRILGKAKGFLRSELAHRLQVRHVPELDFRIDTAIEHGVKMAALLTKLEQKELQSENEE